MKKRRKKRGLGRLLGVSLMTFALALLAVPAEWVFAEEGAQAVSEDGDFVIENGVLIRYNGSGGDVIIPDGVTKIGDQVFQDCEGLISVTIPDGVVEIGNHAFLFCGGLTSVTIPDSVTKIGDYAFFETGLTSITIPGSVVEIGDDAFFNTGLTSITIPNSVVSVGEFAFAHCSSLKEIEFPESVIEIGNGVICACENLTDIAILNKNATLYGHGVEINYCILGEEDEYGDNPSRVYIPNNSKTITFRGYSNSTTQQFAKLLDEHKSEAELNAVTFIALDGGSSDDEPNDNTGDDDNSGLGSDDNGGDSGNNDNGGSGNGTENDGDSVSSGDAGNGDNSSDNGVGSGGNGSDSGTGSGDNGSGSSAEGGNNSDSDSGAGSSNNIGTSNGAADNAHWTDNAAASNQPPRSDMSYMPKTGIEDLMFLKNTFVYGTFLIGAILFVLSFKKRRI